MTQEEMDELLDGIAAALCKADQTATVDKARDDDPNGPGNVLFCNFQGVDFSIEVEPL